MNKTFLFDYDDTLAPNEFHYTIAQSAFLQWMLTRLGPKTPDAQTIFNHIANTGTELVRTMGFRKERYPTTFKTVYHDLCAKFNHPCTEPDLSHAYDLGKLPFDKERYRLYGLFEGAEETLEFLAKQGNELILLTKGDYDVQREKLEATQMHKWFENRMHIVPNKNTAVIKEVLKHRNPHTAWHVGNSIRSDVTPALEAGIGMIYIPCETWAYEREHCGAPQHPKLITLETIAQIKDKYHELQ